MMLLFKDAKKTAQALSQSKQKLVLAESCTGGLAHASLVQIPGISKWLCGSFVVYQEKSKSEWLGINPRLIEKFSVVSEVVALEMAYRSLSKTPSATIAASVTGYLSATKNPADEGRICFAMTDRKNLAFAFTLLLKKDGIETNLDSSVKDFGAMRKFIASLPKLSKKSSPLALRLQRQMLASQVLLFMVRTLLRGKTTSQDQTN